MKIKKFESGPQIKGTLYVCDELDIPAAYKWLKENVSRFTLMSDTEFQQARESWKEYSEWYALLWSVLTIDNAGNQTETLV